MPTAPALAVSSSITGPSVCPSCGQTADELRDSGRMGCATCYQVFEAMVQQAVAELHGYGGAGRLAPPPPLPVDRMTPPWSVRRTEPTS